MEALAYLPEEAVSPKPDLTHANEDWGSPSPLRRALPNVSPTPSLISNSPRIGRNTTEAWVLYNLRSDPSRPVGLQLERFDLGVLEEGEVLVEPIYGGWEGNMGHAVARRPIDVAAFRKEERVVIGNSGVVRVLQPGPGVSYLKEGDLCIVFAGRFDRHGFVEAVIGYDAPGSLGLLAKRTKMHAVNLVKIPDQTRFQLTQWVAYSVRYVTAWANWAVARPCWEATARWMDGAEPWVWGWGGGTAYAEVSLARFFGFNTALIASSAERLRQIEAEGMVAIDRRPFGDLAYDKKRLTTEPGYARRYKQAERCFLETVKRETGDSGVSIFVDQIGSAVAPATIKALGRPGILTTSGWKTGMNITANRAISAMQWHSHVHTHAARLHDLHPAVAFGEANGWMPPVEDCIYAWNDIPQLAEEYEAGKIDALFPLYSINPE